MEKNDVKSGFGEAENGTRKEAVCFKTVAEVLAAHKLLHDNSAGATKAFKPLSADLSEEDLKKATDLLGITDADLEDSDSDDGDGAKASFDCKDEDEIIRSDMLNDQVRNIFQEIENDSFLDSLCCHGHSRDEILEIETAVERLKELNKRQDQQGDQSTQN